MIGRPRTRLLVNAVCIQCAAGFSRLTGHSRSMRFCSRRCCLVFTNDQRKTKTAEQFWTRVAIGAPSDCWEWTSTKDTHGYGQIKWHGEMRLAHRLALSLTDGDWESRLLVRHTCDNKPCCNPAHLQRGTHRDNMQDAIERGRFRPSKGDANGSAKLTGEQVLSIRSSKERTAEVASKFGVSMATVQHIRKRSTWRHLP